MNKIYYCGDLHGSLSDNLLNFFHLNKNSISRKDYFIQLGDFGFVWESLDDEVQKSTLEHLASQNITFCVVLGNHENYDEIEKLPIIKKFGGKVRVLESPIGKIYFFERGEVYKIAGKKIFAFGGALSVDKEFRVLGQSYWEQELPSQKEYDRALKNLEKHNFEVDIVVTHTCPHSIIPYFGMEDIIDDPVSSFFDTLLLEKKLQFKEWRFGHFHIDRFFEHDNKKFKCHYDYITPSMDEYTLVNTYTTSYFGIYIYDFKGHIGVLRSDIEKLPFFEFWEKSSIGSTCLYIQDSNDSLVYLHDWVSFCKFFIETGKYWFMPHEEKTVIKNDNLINSFTKTYFGLDVYSYKDHSGVLSSEIRKLPFFIFCGEGLGRGSCISITNKQGEDIDTLIYYHDWVNFCTLFIETGKHRFMD